MDALKQVTHHLHDFILMYFLDDFDTHTTPTNTAPTGSPFSGLSLVLMGLMFFYLILHFMGSRARPDTTMKIRNNNRENRERDPSF